VEDGALVAGLVEAGVFKPLDRRAGLGLLVATPLATLSCAKGLGCFAEGFVLVDGAWSLDWEGWRSLDTPGLVLLVEVFLCVESLCGRSPDDMMTHSELKRYVNHLNYDTTCKVCVI
jgi:hypothetical protein